jgi:hypothetical protein
MKCRKGGQRSKVYVQFRIRCALIVAPLDAYHFGNNQGSLSKA